MEFTDEEFIKPSVQLTEEQNFAFEKFKDGENIFITGPGGTGKSLFIQNIVKYANQLFKSDYSKTNPDLLNDFTSILDGNCIYLPNFLLFLWFYL